MASAFQLTGGTNDINPQMMKVRCTASAATKDLATSIAVPIPVQRLATGNRAQVLRF